jgi:CPA1 family monovalent cation:H+ antiporter
LFSRAQWSAFGEGFCSHLGTVFEVQRTLRSDLSARNIDFATHVAQGLSLPSLIRFLKVGRWRNDKEERLAQVNANPAALARLDDSRNRIDAKVYEHVRGECEDRLRQLEVGVPATLSQQALGVERRVILQLRNERDISDEVLRRIQRDIDFAETRLQRRH